MVFASQLPEWEAATKPLCLLSPSESIRQHWAFSRWILLPLLIYQPPCCPVVVSIEFIASGKSKQTKNSQILLCSHSSVPYFICDEKESIPMCFLYATHDLHTLLWQFPPTIFLICLFSPHMDGRSPHSTWMEAIHIYGHPHFFHSQEVWYRFMSLNNTIFLFFFCSLYVPSVTTENFIVCLSLNMGYIQKTKQKHHLKKEANWESIPVYTK